MNQGVVEKNGLKQGIFQSQLRGRDQATCFGGFSVTRVTFSGAKSDKKQAVRHRVLALHYRSGIGERDDGHCLGKHRATYF